MSKLDNQKTELFELCKQVYEVTRWRTEDEHPDQFMHLDGHFAYTCDFILVRLPPYIKSVNTRTRLTLRTKPELLRGDPNDLPDWQAMYGHNFSERGDTPLQALLKLTLALHEAGELL